MTEKFLYLQIRRVEEMKIRVFPSTQNTIPYIDPCSLLQDFVKTAQLRKGWVFIMHEYPTRWAYVLLFSYYRTLKTAVGLQNMRHLRKLKIPDVSFFFLNIFNKLKTCFVLDSHGWKTTCFSIIPSSFVLYYFLYLGYL